MLKFYQYAKCGTCRKAAKWLEANGVSAEPIPIRETPPSPNELKGMLAAYDGQIRKLFNTAGQDYRALNVKELISAESTDRLIELLASNGNLVKRPFLWDAQSGKGRVGFSEPEWSELLAQLK